MPEVLNDPKDKVTILLAEYGSLRTGVINRIGNFYQALAVLAALLVFAGRLGDAMPRRYAWIVAAVFMVIISRTVYVDISDMTRRLREIEKAVNELAGHPLMKWQSLLAPTAPKRGYWRTYLFRWLLPPD